MPEISRFYGIVIRMFWREHGPPHFHAAYGDARALIGIDDLAVLKGYLPARARGLVMEWASLHQAELIETARGGVRAGALAADRAVLAELGCFGRTKGSGVITAAGAAYLASRHAAQPAPGVLRAAFESGGDTDTLAATTGGLLGCLAGLEWMPCPSLDVQDASMRLGPLPEWAARLARRLVSRGLLADLPDQAIANEYVGDQGISRHVDAETSFADGIATISLLESWEMVFRALAEPRGRNVTLRLDRRSAAIMTGDARYRWTHEIPPRKNEPGRVPRGRRISLTFRKVLAPASRREERRHA